MKLNINKHKYHATVGEGYIIYYDVELNVESFKFGVSLSPCRPEYIAEKFDMSKFDYINYIKQNFNGSCIDELDVWNPYLNRDYIVFLNKKDCKKFVEWLEQMIFNGLMIGNITYDEIV